MANYKDPVIKCRNPFRSASYWYPQDREYTAEPSEPDLTEEEKQDAAKSYYDDVLAVKEYNKKIDEEVECIPWPKGEE